MLIITAPAKTLDLESDDSCVQVTQPQFLAEAVQVRDVLVSQDFQTLKKTLHASDKIVEQNAERLKNWQAKHDHSTSRPAILTFKGDIYKEMFPHVYTEAEQAFAQKSIRVLSGFYGVLRAYDFMQPHRLEMQAKLSVAGTKNLYEFWHEKLTAAMNEDIKRDGHKYFLNLASEEYSKAIDLESLKAKVVKVDFKDKKDGKLKIIPIFAKKARGMMMEYCIKNLAEDVEDLKGFNTAGYSFKEQDEEGNLLFVR